MDGIEDLMSGEVADFVYTDPPWGQALLKFFQTKNTKDTGASPKHINHEEFVSMFFKTIASHSKKIAVVEYGQRWRDEIILAALDHGLDHRGTALSHYGSKMHPLDIHVFAPRELDICVTQEFQSDLNGLKGFPVIDVCFKHFAPSNGVVLDPCCGAGYTAKAAVKYGLSFRGNEINSARLSKTIDRLE
tara:strand:- start:4125 stop:4691 length:567 start_codon:yes stop_codon:yes gene_type:complete